MIFEYYFCVLVTLSNIYILVNTVNHLTYIYIYHTLSWTPFFSFFSTFFKNSYSRIFNNDDSERSQIKFKNRYQVRDEGRLKRMETVKQLFSAYLDRTEAYNLSIHLGLITYGTNIQTNVKLTPILDDFRDAIDNIEPEGKVGKKRRVVFLQ